MIGEEGLSLRPEEAYSNFKGEIGEPFTRGNESNFHISIKSDSLAEKIMEIVKVYEDKLPEGYYFSKSTDTWGEESSISLWKRSRLGFLGADSKPAYFGAASLVRYDFSDPVAKKLYDLTIGKGRAIYEE